MLMISSQDKVDQLKLASQIPSDFHWVLHHDHVGIMSSEYLIQNIISSYGSMFISKLRSKVVTKNIDSFEDLYINQKKIIIKGNNFVEDFFTHSGSEAVKRVKGD